MAKDENDNQENSEDGRDRAQKQDQLDETLCCAPRSRSPKSVHFSVGRDNHHSFAKKGGGDI
ncbi:MAG: hypothetical protein ACXV3D_02860 [Halobacteriota archaeon]